MATPEEDGGTSPLLRTRVAVLLAAGAAVLSVVTGIGNIGAMGVSGLLSGFVPETAARTAGSTGALTGFLLLTSVYGLRQRYRLTWYATAVLLPVTAGQGLVQSSVLSLPLVVLSVAAAPVLLVNRRYFDRRLDLTATQWASLAAVVASRPTGRSARTCSARSPRASRPPSTPSTSRSSPPRRSATATSRPPRSSAASSRCPCS